IPAALKAGGVDDRMIEISAGDLRQNSREFLDRRIDAGTGLHWHAARIRGNAAGIWPAVLPFRWIGLLQLRFTFGRQQSVGGQRAGFLVGDEFEAFLEQRSKHFQGDINRRCYFTTAIPIGSPIPLLGAFATMTYRSVSRNLGPPTRRSLARFGGISKAIPMRFLSVPVASILPPWVYRMPTPWGPSGGDGLISAVSNSGFSGGKASATPGALSVGFRFTLSTTMTGIASCLDSSFKPSCFSTASKIEIPSAPAAVSCARAVHLISKSHAPVSFASSITGLSR